MSNQKSRYTVNFSDERYQEVLKSIAKKFQITQGEVIEVFLDTYSETAFGPGFRLKRTVKINARTSVRAAIERQKLERQKGRADEDAD